MYRWFCWGNFQAVGMAASPAPSIEQVEETTFNKQPEENNEADQQEKASPRLDPRERPSPRPSPRGHDNEMEHKVEGKYDESPDPERARELSPDRLNAAIGYTNRGSMLEHPFERNPTPIVPPLPQSGIFTPRLSVLASINKGRLEGTMMNCDGDNPFVAPSIHGSTSTDNIDRDQMLAKAYAEKTQMHIKAWERHKATTNMNKYESEIARINSWENSQIARAEARLRLREEEFETRRAKLAEHFKNEIATIHRKAEEAKALAETRRVEEILQIEEGAVRCRATGKLPKKSLLKKCCTSLKSKLSDV